MGDVLKNAKVKVASGREMFARKAKCLSRIKVLGTQYQRQKGQLTIFSVEKKKTQQHQQHQQQQ